MSAPRPESSTAAPLPLSKGLAAPARTASGSEPRERLLRTALGLFAHQGFSRTSVREIAEAAQVNVAAISYYFGDKAGLYRAAFFEPVAGSSGVGEPCDPAAFDGAPLDVALKAFFTDFLAPLRESETARLCMKLRYREMLEPTGLWQEEIALGIRPVHDAMVGLLARHLGCDADDGVQRLVICLTGLAVHLHVAQDVIEQVAPGVAAPPAGVDAWIECLVRHGMALVEGERQHRAAQAPRGVAP